MIRRFLSRLFRPSRDIGAMIARRGMRLNNRDSKSAAAYERVHEVLLRGPGKC